MVDQNDAFPVTAMSLDAVGYSTRSIPVHLQWRREISNMTAEAFRLAGIDQRAVSTQDTGDGHLTMIPAAVPKARVVADLVRELRIALTSFNLTRNPMGRLRLRLALHAGECVVDGTGFAGEAAIVVSRLVNSSPVRSLVADQPGVDLAVIVSDRLYRDTVAQRLRGLDPACFQAAEVRTANFHSAAWLYVPTWVQPGSDQAETSTGPAPAQTTSPTHSPTVQNTFRDVTTDFFNAGVVHGRRDWRG